MCYRLPMRLTLKHQILLAPAVVLCIMTLLLGFLQFNYWHLSLQRERAKELKSAFIAMAEADLAAQRMQSLAQLMVWAPEFEAGQVAQLTELHRHMDQAVDYLQEIDLIDGEMLDRLEKSIDDLDPRHGLQPEKLNKTLDELRPRLNALLDKLNEKRQKVSNLHGEDMDELVAQTTFVGIVVLGSAILAGVLLSLTFARRILRRIKLLSDSAEQITRGEFVPPAAPEVIRDELDGLALSINRMTDQLIRVVAAEKLLEGAEEERRRIAMDIHDQTLSDLASVRRGLERLGVNPSCSGSCAPAVLTIETDLQRAIANLRTVMDDLHPQTLDILGLPAAIEAHLERLAEQENFPEFHFLAANGVGQLRLSRLAKVTLYRIAVEAIHNVQRHASATVLEVGLERRGDTLILAVEDNGRGFDFTPRLPGSEGGRGLHNVRERARAIGAQVVWGPARFSSGTRFELLLPLDVNQGKGEK
ncbi:MAG: HAMP domain-containing protein [Desulfuromonas sp.]|nr:HAMP domain-containing protein [Desulfuromonas sp.]